MSYSFNTPDARLGSDVFSVPRHVPASTLMRKLLADPESLPPAVRSGLHSDYRRVYFHLLSELSREAGLIRAGLASDLEAAIRFDVQSRLRLGWLWTLGLLHFTGLARFRREALAAVDSFERFLRPTVADTAMRAVPTRF